MPSTVVSVVLGVLALYVVKTVLMRKKPLGPLPPGPKGKPVVGNISDLPPPGTQDWVHWLKHKDLYGMPGKAAVPLTRSRMLVLIPQSVPRTDQFDHGNGTDHCDTQ